MYVTVIQQSLRPPNIVTANYWAPLSPYCTPATPQHHHHTGPIPASLVTTSQTTVSMSVLLFCSFCFTLQNLIFFLVKRPEHCLCVKPFALERC